MKWNILLFESQRGDKPVEEFIKSQNSKTIAKIMHVIDLLEKYGSFLSMPHSKKLSSPIYELRVRGKPEIRILYVFIDGNICLLHAFKKQTQKTPKKEIDTALKRLKVLTKI
jgi:phage-related protein